MENIRLLDNLLLRTVSSLSIALMDQNSDMLGQIPSGEIVTGTGAASGEWIQVYFPINEENTDSIGWVSGNYLEEIVVNDTIDEPENANPEQPVTAADDNQIQPMEILDANPEQPEATVDDASEQSAISSAENADIYNNYRDIIDPAIANFTPSSLYSRFLSVGESADLGIAWPDVICYSDNEAVVTVSSSDETVTATGVGEAHVVIISKIALTVYENMGSDPMPLVYLYVVS